MNQIRLRFRNTNIVIYSKSKHADSHLSISTAGSTLGLEFCSVAVNTPAYRAGDVGSTPTVITLRVTQVRSLDWEPFF